MNQFKIIAANLCADFPLKSRGTSGRLTWVGSSADSSGGGVLYAFYSPSEREGQEYSATSTDQIAHAGGSLSGMHKVLGSIP